MLATKEIIRLIQSKAIDANHGLRLIEDLLYARETASVCSWRNEEGQKAKVFANGFMDKLKEAKVIPILRNLTSMSYYPMNLDGKSYDMSQKSEILEVLITRLEDKEKETK